MYNDKWYLGMMHYDHIYANLNKNHVFCIHNLAVVAGGIFYASL